MKILRDEAIVLRARGLGGADHIVTLLSANNGLVRVVAHGMRKTTSWISARLEPFGAVGVLIRLGRGGLHNAEQAGTLAPYGRSIAADHALFTTANLMVETLERLSEEAWVASRYYRLTLGALRALALSRHEPRLVLDSYLLRLLSLAGRAASCWGCVTCGANGPYRYFNPTTGRTVCGEYKPHGTAPMALETMHLLAAPSVGDWPRAEASKAAERARAHPLVMAFVQWHMERRPKSLTILRIA